MIFDVKAKMVFFDTTPMGRILNRLSSDVYAVDESLPFVLNIFLAQVFGLFGMTLLLKFSDYLNLFSNFLCFFLNQVPLLSLVLGYLGYRYSYYHLA